MNIAKNMEAIFLVAVALVTSMGFANASASAPKATQAIEAVAAQKNVDPNMTVVTVSAKRLSAAEKAKLGG